jgi:(p)ppGpp synthase/HD superfamily hydrolase
MRYFEMKVFEGVESEALYRAMLLAKTVFYGEVDKAGRPYFLHCEGVARRVYVRDPKDVVGMIVGFLHDVVEDTSVPLSEIREEFGEEVAAAVDAISQRKHETRREYMDRCLKHPIAARVKLADIDDNMGRPGAGDSLMRYYNAVYPKVIRAAGIEYALGGSPCPSA